VIAAISKSCFRKSLLKIEIDYFSDNKKIGVGRTIVSENQDHQGLNFPARKA
jgi:hypothetical protein